MDQWQERKSGMDNTFLSSYFPLMEKHLLSTDMPISQLSK